MYGLIAETVERRVVYALKFFGQMNKTEIKQKLFMVGMQVEYRDLDQALAALVRNKYVRKTDCKKKYVTTDCRNFL